MTPHMHIYTYIYNKTKTERVFHNEVIYLSHIQNKGFRDAVISLVQ